jgi:hypothetical protein
MQAARTIDSAHMKGVENLPRTPIKYSLKKKTKGTK